MALYLSGARKMYDEIFEAVKKWVEETAIQHSKNIAFEIKKHEHKWFDMHTRICRSSW